MYSDTKEKIANIIKESNGVSAHTIITTLNLNASGIFRHLKHLSKDGKIIKIGKPPKVIYYPNNTMNQNQQENNAANWALTGDSRLATPQELCSTRDVFQARHDKMLEELKKNFDENIAFIVAVITGEIGNNSFDHNLGNWRDIAGIFFLMDLTNHEIILADRGQGVFSSIKRVQPETKTDIDALQTAFTKIISGRYPEKRGNGLKIVAEYVEKNNLFLKFYSGNAVCKISNAGLKVEKSNQTIPGSLAIIKF